MDHEEKISKVLRSLPQVEAPQHFEAGVRARIAQGRTSKSERQPLLLLGAKFAFPLVLLLILGGILIFTNQPEIDRSMVPAIDDAGLSLASVDSPPESGQATSAVDPTSENRVPPANRRTKSPDNTLPAVEDQALSRDDSTVFPKGVDPRNAGVSNRPLPTAGSISPESVLSMIGISSSCSSTGCRAIEVRSGSIAEKSGVRTGDMVEAIEDRLVGSTKPLQGRISVESLTIMRDGRRITLRITRP